MQTNTISSGKSALQFGVFLGVIFIIISLLIYILELYDQQWMNYVSSAILIVGIVIGIKNRRDKELGGAIAYGAALGYGTLVSLISAIVSSIVTMSYLAFVDDSFIQFTLEQQEMQFYESGMPDEQIEVAMEYTKKFTSPLWMGIMAVLVTTIFGFIVSLIASAFLKKEEDIFAE